MNKHLLVIPAIALALSGAGCGSKTKEAKAGEGPPIRVSTMTVQPEQWPEFYEATGTVRARVSVQVSSRVMSYVREVRAKVGDLVKAGQPLVVLDSRDFQAQQRQATAGRVEAQAVQMEAEHAVAAAQASLQLAEVTFRRMKDLYDKKSLSDQEFDEASARLKNARANLDMAQSRGAQVKARIAQADEQVRYAEITGGYSVIAAPVSGVVTDKNIEPGNLAMPGAPLMTVEQSGGYRLEVAIEESNLAKIRPSQPVTVVLDALPGEVRARVSEIVPAVDPSARTFTAKIDLPPSTQLRSGQFGRARFETGQRLATAIPAAALREKGQVQWVYVAADGRARTRMLTAGARRADKLEVLSGLSGGERIVYPVPANIRDGARVEVRP